MNPEALLQIQSYLDGELSAGEAKKVSDRLAKDGEARLIFEELKMTQAALRGNELEIRLPESRDFYFSKIQNEIRRQEAQSERTAPRFSLFSWLHRFLVPAASVAAVVAITVTMAHKTVGSSDFTGEVEAPLDEMGAFTFRNEAERMTVVWLYDRPSDSDVANEVPTANPYE